MKCSQWQFILATAEASELAENVALQEHLATCAACAQCARELETLRRATRSLPKLSPATDFGAAIRRRIEDQQTKAVARPVPAAMALAQPAAALVRALTWLILAVGLAAVCYPVVH